MRRLSLLVVTAVLLIGGATQAQMFDITNPGDPVVGVPNDNNWPVAEIPPYAIDNAVTVKYLCFETSFVNLDGVVDTANGGAGFRVTPSGPKVVVKALRFASANDATERDPVAFRFSGSDDSINGPYTLIAEGTIDDFDQTTAWPRNSWISAPIPIKNRKAYLHYEVFFTDIRDRSPANSMQIGEVELLSDGSLPGTAGAPIPIDGATDVVRDIALSWAPGDMAATHDVYFGTVFTDVNEAGRADAKGVLISQDQTDTTFDPEGLLEYGRTYYWRIDEVNAAPDYTIFKGDVWTFTVEPFSYPIAAVTATASSAQPGMGPENTVNGSGLNDNDEHSTELPHMWMSSGTLPNWIQYEFDKVYKLDKLLVWNSNQLIETFLGFGAKDVTVEYSADGVTWAALEGVPEFTRATAAPTYQANTTVDLGGVEAQFVKLTINANWGGVAPQTGLSEVRFLYIPVQAFAPQPADAATGVSIDTELNWRPGREAEGHEVFLGADAAALAPVDEVAGSTATPGVLDLATTYFWQVNEIGGGGPYEGDVWSFTTETFIVVDGMESYNDDDNRIYDAWIDGLTDPAKGGSQVGYDISPFAEKAIAHTGQSMPLIYNNAGSAFAEATITFDPAQDWTASGVQSLSLWFRGAAGNTGQLYLKINNTKVAYDGDPADVAATAWRVWNIDLSTVGNVASVRTLTIGIEGSGATGTLYVDDIRLYPQAPQYILPVEPAAANLVAHYKFDEGSGTKVNDASGKGNHGTAFGNPKWSVGILGGAMTFDGTDDYIDCGNGASVSNVESVSVSAWIIVNAASRDHKIASNQSGVGGGYKMGLYTNSMVEFEVRTAANAATLNRTAPGGTALQMDTWYHVVGVYEQGKAIRTYVNGRLDRELLTTVVAAPSTGALMLGREAPAGAYWWQGQMDDVRVYNQALSAAEVAGLAGQTEPMHQAF